MSLLMMMLPDIRRVRTDDMDAVERRSTVSVSWSHAGAVRERERAACASATQSQEGGVSDEEVANVRAGAERVRAQRPSDKVARPSAAARSRPAPSVLPPPRRSDTARAEGEANARASARIGRSLRRLLLRGFVVIATRCAAGRWAGPRAKKMWGAGRGRSSRRGARGSPFNG